jgi:hypothetical protein
MVFQRSELRKEKGVMNEERQAKAKEESRNN